MTIIQIKRTSAVTAPTTSDLVEAELAYAEDKATDGAGAILYIESVNNDDSAAIHKIGGKYYTDKADAFLTNQTASVGAKVNFLEGTNNGSHKVIVKAPNSLAADLTLTLPSADGSNGHVLQTNGSGVLSFAAPASSSFTLSDNQGTPNTDSFATGETLTFAGTAGIKTTITNNQVGIVVDVNGTTVLTSLADADEFLVYDASATANRKITAEDIGDYIYAGLSGDITVTEGGVVSIAANSVTLGTDTTGNYVATLAGTANQLTVTGSGSETAAVTVALTTDVTLVGDLTVGGNDINMNGGGTALTFSGSGDVKTYGDLIVGGQDIKSANGTTAITLVDTTGNVTVAGDLKVGGNDILASDGATALTLAVSTGNVTVAGDLKVGGNDILASDGATALTLAVSTGNVTVAGDLIVGGQDIKSANGTTAITLVDTTGDVTVAGDLTVTGNDIKSSGGTVALTLSGANVTVAGNLTVSGTTTSVNSTTVSVVDPLLALASNNNSTDVVDIGLFGTYDTSGTQDLFTGLFRDATDDKWKLFKSLQAAPTTTVNTAGTGYAIATLIANLESASVAITGGSITGITDITVADGGTGVSTFTSNGIVYGNGSGALQVTAAGANGYILYSNSGTPAWTNTIDGGSY